MYRRPRFLEILIAIREEMARDADFDVDLFVEMARSGKGFERSQRHSMADRTISGNHGSTGRTVTKKK
ncbi:MAG TPA: hypothetical protein VJ781_04340 [Pyrinomonadaceae bacterium]|nr:hypothetical protein [Pyrinomonadaceae bacterium]